MEYIRECLHNKISKYIILLISLILFILTYIAKMYNALDFNTALGIKDIAFGFMFLFILVTDDNPKLVILLAMLYPISAYSDFLASMNTVIALSFLIAIGIVIHLIIYKPKFKIGKYSLGLYLLFIAWGLSGILCKDEAYNSQDITNMSRSFLLLCLVGTPLILICVNSFVKTDFNDFCDYMLVISILIVSEIIIFFTRFNGHFLDYNSKQLTLVWGISNNIAAFLCACIPFVIYKGLCDKKLRIIYVIQTILIIDSIIVSFSKGAIIALGIGLVILFIASFIKYNKLKVFLYSILVALIVILPLVFIYYKYPDYSKQILDQLNFGTMNSRKVIWESALKIFNENKISGIGYYGATKWRVDTWGYQFAHDTFLEAMLLGGIPLLVCLIIHLIDKYSRLIYKLNFKKFIILMSFLIPGLYGLIDVTYFLTTYTIILGAELILAESLIENDKPKWLINLR